MNYIADYLHRPDLARFPFLFVVTYGRSGSTLLNGLLNSLPGYCIRGENGGVMLHLFRACKAVSHSRYTFGGKPAKPTHAWSGSHLIAPERIIRDVADSFVENVLAPPLDAHCIGFKEIRYTNAEMPDAEFPELLDFMAEAFPQANFILNLRDIHATAKSGWWANQERGPVINRLNNARNRLTAFHSNHPANSFLFDYDQVVRDIGHFGDLCEFLGERFDPETANTIIGTRHSTIA